MMNENASQPQFPWKLFWAIMAIALLLYCYLHNYDYISGLKEKAHEELVEYAQETRKEEPSIRASGCVWTLTWQLPAGSSYVVMKELSKDKSFGSWESSLTVTHFHAWLERHSDIHPSDIEYIYAGGGKSTDNKIIGMTIIVDPEVAVPIEE